VALQDLKGQAGVLGGQEAYILHARIHVVQGGITPSSFSSGGDERGHPSLLVASRCAR